MTPTKKNSLKQPEFLPASPQELAALGWPLDILLVSGDAYVDHPSFAVALLGRWLVEHGFGVAILAQPAWEGEEALQAFSSFPRPRLFAGVSAGAIDSMLAHYTAFRKKRHDDAYTPGGKAGARPNRASFVYTGLIRRAWPGLPVVLGGLEASLRRVSHYDFWSDSLRKSILPDSKADLLLCGMGEESILALANLAEALKDSSGQDKIGPERDAFRKNLSKAASTLPGAVTLHSAGALAQICADLPEAPVPLATHNEILQAPGLLVKNTVELELHSNQGKRFLTQGVDQRTLLLAPPPAPVSCETLDKIYSLPYSRLPHPAYREAIPAWEMIRTSITTHRGCGGGCSFCSLALHQGRKLSSRSKESILAEARLIAAGPEQQQGKKAPKWAGSISDVGGPSANMWQGYCAFDPERCRRASCLFPKACPHFKVDQGGCVDLLREVGGQEGVRHVRVASGVRYDMVLKDHKALAAYSMEFTGGQLKVAPEHISSTVLNYMRKPERPLFEQFITEFKKLSAEAGKEQYVIPYLISAFPGCTTEHMKELKNWLKVRGWSPKQVQCFIPTPGTVATAMYYASEDPEGNKIYVAKSDKERMAQHYILLGDDDSAVGHRHAGARPAAAASKQKRRQKNRP